MHVLTNFSNIMHLSRYRGKGVSEVLAAVLMLALTIVGFAIIAPLLVQNTQSQASSIINDIRKGEIQEGQSLSLVYQYFNFSVASPYVNFGLLNYGSAPVLIKYIFVFTTSQTYDVTDNFTLTDVTVMNAPVTCSQSAPNCQIDTKHVVMLQIEFPASSSIPAEKAMDGGSPYQLVLYTTTGLEYTFSGEAS